VKRYQFWFLILLLTILTACDGILSEDENDHLERNVVNSLKGVKLISEDILDGRDESTFTEETYLLNSNRRMLLRFEKIRDEVGSVVIDNTTRMFMILKLTDGQNLEDYFGKIEICPLLKNWMMLATWNYAHPFAGKKGKWGNPGGDFNFSECIGINEENSKIDSNEAYFDISDWFIHNIQSGRSNFGWVVISEEDITIIGDNNAAHSPRVVWREIF